MKEERKAVWKEIDKEKVKNDVSKRAVENNEGLEFVAEVFKGLVKGEKYDNYIMGFYNRLKGPKVKLWFYRRSNKKRSSAGFKTYRRNFTTFSFNQCNKS